MKTDLVAVCFSLLVVTVVLLHSAEPDPRTVKDQEDQFKIFGPKYIQYRKMQDEPKQAKDDALKELWNIVKANKWNRGDPAEFYLEIVDPATFKIGKGEGLFPQLNDIFPASKPEHDLKGIPPFSLFRDPAVTKENVSGELKTNLINIEAFVKEKFAALFYMDLSQVAYHYELFNGQDLEKPDDLNERKEYALIMFAFATE